MDRLTERDEFGNADIIEVDSAEFQLSLDFDDFNRVTNALNKLAEYEDLEEQRRLLKLPCAVGDTVYTACSWGIESGVVGSIKIISDRIFVNNIQGQMIGEAGNIFLTKSAAERALKEIEGKK